MSQLTVLDASVVLAFLQAEPGHDTVRLALQNERCVVTAANQAEIIAKAIDKGVDPVQLGGLLADLPYTVIDVTANDGAAAGWMYSSNRSIGLSLGDRNVPGQRQTSERKSVDSRPSLAGCGDIFGFRNSVHSACGVLMPL